MKEMKEASGTVSVYSYVSQTEAELGTYGGTQLMSVKYLDEVVSPPNGVEGSDVRSVHSILGENNNLSSGVVGEVYDTSSHLASQHGN